MKKYLILIFALVLFLVPSKAMAATYEIGSSDFEDAKTAAGTETQKEIFYDSEEEVFYLGNNTYKLKENIAIEDDYAGNFAITANTDGSKIIVTMNTDKKHEYYGMTYYFKLTKKTKVK